MSTATLGTSRMCFFDTLKVFFNNFWIILDDKTIGNCARFKTLNSVNSIGTGTSPKVSGIIRNKWSIFRAVTKIFENKWLMVYFTDELVGL